MILPTKSSESNKAKAANDFVKKLLSQEYTNEMKGQKIESFGSPKANK